jgi:uncharacterized cupredoxin-like copper-binding protein
VQRRTVKSAAALVAAGAVAVPLATASGQSAHSAGGSIRVSGKEFKFTLSRNSISHGRVTFSFKNTGKLKHDFKIAGHKTRLVKPGRSTSLTVSLRKGTYSYICTVTGHAQAGMKGRLRVR